MEWNGMEWNGIECLARGASTQCRMGDTRLTPGGRQAADRNKRKEAEPFLALLAQFWFSRRPQPRARVRPVCLSVGLGLPCLCGFAVSVQAADRKLKEDERLER